ncbi:hypothetical protein [Gilvibacter sp.]|uniref:hypothetical protein n=1 Tax=Gilvibacter sp. TaxID=2729997 RepID=UPI003B52369C
MKFASYLIIILLSTPLCQSFGQNIEKENLYATWRLIREQSESENQVVKIEVTTVDEFEKVIDSLPRTREKYNNSKESKPAPSNSSSNGLHIKFVSGKLTEYIFGDAFEYPYSISGNTMTLGDFDLKIVTLSENVLILKGEVELKFERVKTDPEINRLFKDKAPVRGIYNPLILYSYPGD